MTTPYQGYARLVNIRSITLKALACATVALLAACGGGGSGAPRSTAGTSPTPPPTGGSSYQGHIVVEFGNGRHTEIVPAGGAPALGPGESDGGPIPRGVVIYPDGSKQVADANGIFTPYLSSYGTKNQALLQANAQAQPQVIIVDPRGTARATTGIVEAYTRAHALVRARTSNAIHPAFATKMSTVVTPTNLAGVTLLPAYASMLSTGIQNLDVEGTDSSNNVVSLSGATISWNSTLGAQVIPFNNAQSAYYFPPSLASGSTIDTVSVAVQVGNDPNNVFYASTQINVLGPGSTATAQGIVTANATPVPQALAVFAEPGPSQLFSPSLWLAQTDANGNYSVQLPAQRTFALGAGLPDAYSPSGSYDVFVAQQPNGATSFTSGAVGTTTQPVNLLTTSASIPFSFASPYDMGSVPSYVPFVRNAWYATYGTILRRIFEADSGVQPLLASAPTTLPYPANPAPVGAGQFGAWCYQWQSIGGSPSLVLIENTAATCSQPGNDAFVVTPTGNNAYSYVKYASNTTYPIAGTVDVITNSLLVESGTWSQTTSSNSSGAITNDTATVSGQFYDVNNQTLGSPVYNETLQYNYSLGANGLATSQFTNDTRTSAWDATTVSVENATQSQVAPLGSSGCQAGAGTAACYTVSGTVNVDTTGSGVLDGSYAITDTFNGNGSAQLAFQSTKTGDSSKIVLPVTSDAYGNAHGCIVCTNNLGQLYDTDGVTYLGTIAIDSAHLVRVTIYDTQPGSSTLGINAIDALGFVL